MRVVRVTFSVTLIQINLSYKISYSNNSNDLMHGYHNDLIPVGYR